MYAVFSMGLPFVAAREVMYVTYKAAARCFVIF